MSSYLPEELILNILSRLEVKTLLRFRCVCKSWFNLLTSHDFIKMHLNHAHQTNNFSLMIFGDQSYYIDNVSSPSSSSSSELCYEALKIDEPFESTLIVNISGSCNGLFCSESYHGSTFIIWNPSTKEYREISMPRPITPRYIAHGFGYDCKIDDYKFVRISSDEVNLDVNVYTLGSNSWRNIRSSVLINPYVAKRRRVGVLLNGALHWIQLESRENKESQVIVSFDLGDERLQEIELPNCLVGRKTSNVGVLRGELCVIGADSNDVWVMKDYGVIESWTKLFSIAKDTSIFYKRPIYSFKNGEIMFEVCLKEGEFGRFALVSYDAEHERARMLEIRGCPRLFMTVETYVGSLVSPNRVHL